MRKHGAIPSLVCCQRWMRGAVDGHARFMRYGRIAKTVGWTRACGGRPSRPLVQRSGSPLGGALFKRQHTGTAFAARCAREIRQPGQTDRPSGASRTCSASSHIGLALPANRWHSSAAATNARRTVSQNALWPTRLGGPGWSRACGEGWLGRWACTATHQPAPPAEDLRDFCKDRSCGRAFTVRCPTLSLPPLVARAEE